MSDNDFNKQDFIDATHEIVPSFQVNRVLSVIDADDLEETELEQIGLSLTGEKRDSGIIVPTSAPNKPQASLWGAIKLEVYDYLCTTSRKYSKERKEAGITIKNLITILATAVASTFNVAIGVVAGAVTIALLSALKIGKNAWCHNNMPSVL